MADVKTQAKTERLKAALRENLKRRKAQARGRETSEVVGAPDVTGEQTPSTKRRGE